MAQMCYRHPRRQTSLSCGRCERPICSACVVHTEVGIRCPQCARPVRVPGLDVGVMQYLVAAAVGLGQGAVVGGVYGLVLPFIRWIPFLPWIAFLFLGYTIGEGISRATRRKGGRGLQTIAGASVVLLYVVSNLVAFGVPYTLNPFALVLTVIAVAVAASRVS